MCVLPECVYVQHMCTWCPGSGARKRHWIPFRSVQLGHEWGSSRRVASALLLSLLIALRVWCMCAHTCAHARTRRGQRSAGIVPWVLSTLVLREVSRCAWTLMFRLAWQLGSLWDVSSASPPTSPGSPPASPGSPSAGTID